MSVGSYAGGTDTGRRRRRNEDSFVIAPPVFGVADGMGGAQAGEVASRLAASALEAGDSDGLEGTTVAIGHVGDSRAYLVRGEQMEQLTEDHSLVNELLKTGKLSEEEAQVHPQRSVITRAVGTDPDVDVDGFTIEAEEGDIFLICSDGLSDMVEDEEILELVHANRDDLDRAVKALVSAANRGGGEDNITAVAFQISSADVPNLEDTVAMPALDAPDDEPDEQTREYAAADQVEDDPGGDTMIVAPDDLSATDGSPRPNRVRIVLLGIVVLVLVAALIIWLLAR